MKRIGILGGLFPDEIRKEIEAKSIGPIQYAADALQWNLIHSLDDHVCDLSLINLPYIGSFPTRYKDIKIKSFAFSHRPDAKDYNVGFNNLPLYKNFSRYYAAKKYLMDWVTSDKEIIIIYAIHTPFILAAIAAQKVNSNLKICLIVPDLPEHMGGRETIIMKLFKRIEKKILDSALSKIDAFVVLSKYMVEPLKIGDRPWICIEGMYSGEVYPSFISESSIKKTVFYSGTLAARYGILDLLDAFEMIEDSNYELWICGDGDTRSKIIEKVKIDSRIKYLGQLPREQILKLQRNATMLINPRTAEGEFTKFSFPSKTIEYLASGTPTILHKLPGIPEEYLNYCFVTKNDNAEGLREMIIHVGEKSIHEMISFGKAAQTFILDNKTTSQQGAKLMEMLKLL